jgi:hypothetical protein
VPDPKRIMNSEELVKLEKKSLCAATELEKEAI